MVKDFARTKEIDNDWVARGDEGGGEGEGEKWKIKMIFVRQKYPYKKWSKFSIL